MLFRTASKSGSNSVRVAMRWAAAHEDLLFAGDGPWLERAGRFAVHRLTQAELVSTVNGRHRRARPSGLRTGSVSLGLECAVQIALPGMFALTHVLVGVEYLAPPENPWVFRLPEFCLKLFPHRLLTAGKSRIFGQVFQSLLIGADVEKHFRGTLAKVKIVVVVVAPIVEFEDAALGRRTIHVRESGFRISGGPTIRRKVPNVQIVVVADAANRIAPIALTAQVVAFTPHVDTVPGVRLDQTGASVAENRHESAPLEVSRQFQFRHF